MLYSLGTLARACLTISSTVIGPHGNVFVDLCSVDIIVMSELQFSVSQQFSSSHQFYPLFTGSLVYRSTRSSLDSMQLSLLVATDGQFYAYTRDEICSFPGLPGFNSASMLILRDMSIRMAAPESVLQVLASVIVDNDFSVVSVSKAKCLRCSFLSAVDGHRNRCATAAEVCASNASSVRLRRMAWLGDALHHFDVRLAVLSRVSSSSELEPAAQAYTTASVQARWYRDNLHTFSHGHVVAALGSAESHLSTAFEASYAGEFRRRYCTEVLGIEPLLRYDGTFELSSYS